MRDCYVVLEPCLENLDLYRNAILQADFKTYDYGNGQTFHNMAELPSTPFSEYVASFFPNHAITGHFARKSPQGQIEPNYIHTDDMHGDITCILYLNPVHPDCGTVLYDDDDRPSVTIHMSYGKAFFFDSRIKHSRILKENFGDDESARLIEVVFLKGI